MRLRYTPVSLPNTKARKRLISCCSSENAAEHSIGRFFKITKTTSPEGNPNALHCSKCCAMRRALCFLGPQLSMVLAWHIVGLMFTCYCKSGRPSGLPVMFLRVLRGLQH
jgi:hypothetical protein